MTYTNPGAGRGSEWEPEGRHGALDPGEHPPATAPPGPPGGPGRRPPRRVLWRRRVVAALVVLAVVVAAVLGGGYLWLSSQLSRVHKTAVAGLVPAAGPVTFLLTGSDSRAAQPPGASSHFGSSSAVAGQRSDVIILVRVNPGAHTAAMLSIPRDILVPIAGTNSSNRINVAFNAGPDQLVATIRQTWGIDINHYATIDFSGLQQLTDAVGGVCLNFPFPVRDGSPTGTGNESGLNIPTAGQHVLDGNQALAFVRSRYYLYYKNGSWHAEGTGDVGRITRQHEYMRALASRIVHTSLRNPLTARAVIGHAASELTVDKTLSSNTMMRLAFDMRSLRPSSIPSWTMPYTAVSSYQGYGDVLLPDRARDAQVISQWENYTPPSSSSSNAPATTQATLAPSKVRVKVLNGSGTAGQAAQAADGLRSAGFTVTGTGDARSFTVTGSVVAYAPGHQAEAQTVASHVRGPVTVREESSLRGATVVLTTGSGYAGITGGAGSSSGATPTTAPPAPPGQSPLPPWDPTPC